MTTTTTTTFKENLETLYNSLERKERELNKVSSISFYCLKENLENKEKIQTFIMDLHNEESPNDWRYDIIHSILESLINNYEKSYIFSLVVLGVIRFFNHC